MVDPVVAPDGHTYERVAIETWLQLKTTSPMTREEMDPTVLLVPNHNLRSQIREALDRLGDQKNPIKASNAVVTIDDSDTSDSEDSAIGANDNRECSLFL
jgi:hypothetical protein